MPALAMRMYREPEMPIEVEQVRGNTAVLRTQGASPRTIEVTEGSTIPGSHLSVIRVSHRTEVGKDGESSADLHVVEVQDLETGETREWLSGRAATSHDPAALLEDTATGQRYLAMPGQRFTAADGKQFTVVDVRPNQIIIEDRESGKVRTLPLRGPRG